MKKKKKEFIGDVDVYFWLIIIMLFLVVGVVLGEVFCLWFVIMFKVVYY